MSAGVPTLVSTQNYPVLFLDDVVQRMAESWRTQRVRASRIDLQGKVRLLEAVDLEPAAGSSTRVGEGRPSTGAAAA